MAFEDGLIHRCAVEARGELAQDDAMGDATAWGSVPGLEAVACRLTTPRGREAARAAHRESVITQAVYFAADLRLTNRNRLVFADQARTLQVLAAALDPEQLRYVAWCEEVQG